MNDKQPEQNTLIKKALDLLSTELSNIKDSLKSLETLVKNTQNQKRSFSGRARFDLYAIPIITLMGIALSVGVASYWNHKQDERARLYKEADALTVEINERLAKRDLLMSAITNIRSIRDEGQDQCVDGKFASPDLAKFNRKFYAAMFSVINAYYLTTGIFNTSVKNKIINFITLIDPDKNYICTKNTTSDATLLPLQAQINDLMLKEIEQAKTQRQYLVDSADST